jgi:hypothetical protein
MIKLLFILTITLAAHAHSNDEYFIDVADQTVTIQCLDDCPASAGKLIIARPMKISQIQTPDDIQIGTCHATLIAPDKILTAGHCAFRWSHGGWMEQAKNDCSKVFSFYLNDGVQKARCKKILDPIEVSLSRKHTFPDGLVIQLDQSFEEYWSYVATPQMSSIVDDVVQIWGESTNPENAGLLVRRECQVIPESVLVPLAPKGAYVAVECDGPIVAGWSGASAFLAGESIGVVSQSISQTGHHQSLFGNNKAVISLNRCANRFGSTANGCRISEEEFDRALFEIYYSAVDKEILWINQTRSSLERTFSGSQFEYVIIDNETGARTRGFKRVDDYTLDQRIPSFVELDFTSFHPKYVRFNSRTQIIGLFGVSPVLEPGIGGRFYLPVLFHFED